MRVRLRIRALYVHALSGRHRFTKTDMEHTGRHCRHALAHSGSDRFAHADAHSGNDRFADAYYALPHVAQFSPQDC